MTQVAATHRLIFDIHEDDVYWCTADIGWVTGHSYIVYGPLANHTTGIIYEGAPDWPDKDRLWSIAETYKATILYTAPTAIRAFMRWGTEFPERHDLSSLRLLGSVGEPINPEAWVWYWKHIGGERCPVVDTWWQTETGAILITPLPGVTSLKPGSATDPFPGIEADVFDEAGNSVPFGGGGYLVLKHPWPSIARTIWGDPDRYVNTYFSQYGPQIYVAGDGAKRDEDGYYWLLGRIDDVMNVAGHRLSTYEIESALVDDPKVAEAAVVSRPESWWGRRALEVTKYLATAAALASLVLLPYLWPYWRAHADQGLNRSLAAIAPASWRDYLTTPARFDYWLLERWTSSIGLFPGFVGLALTAYAIATGALKDPRARMCLALGVCGVVLSFGADVPGFSLLYAAFTPLHGIRAIGRFGYLGTVATMRGEPRSLTLSAKVDTRKAQAVAGRLTRPRTAHPVRGYPAP
jgi:hypothetical protein